MRSLTRPPNGHRHGVRKLEYWFVVLLLAALTVASFSYTMSHWGAAAGLYGLFFTLLVFAVFLAFALSMRDRDRRSPPIAR